MAPTNDYQTLYSPFELLNRVSQMSRTFNARYSNGYNCGSAGYLNSLGSTGKCIYKRRADNAASAADRYKKEGVPTTTQTVVDDELTVECPPGEAMYKIYRSSLTYIALCSPVPGLGECQQHTYKKVLAGLSNSGLQPTNFVNKYNANNYLWPASQMGIACPGSEVIASFTSSYDVSQYSVSVDVMCCKFPGYGGLTLVQKPVGFAASSGSYCPVELDEMSRPVFKQSRNMGGTTPGANKLVFYGSVNQWCLNGLNSRGKVITSQCAGDNSEHPLDQDWVTIKSRDPSIKYTVAALADLTGEGLKPAGLSAGASSGASKPKKPTLIKFKTVEPEYHAGCEKIAEAASPEDFTEAKDLFTESDSPCKLVAEAEWTDSGSGESKGPGMTYNDLDGCTAREEDRAFQQAQYTLGFAVPKSVAEIAIAWGKLGCAFLPEPSAGGGLGAIFLATIKTKDICGDIVDAASTTISGALDIAKEGLDFTYAKLGYDDCNAVQAGMNRVLCDLYCVKDAVKSGTKAVIQNIAASNENILTNSKMLMEYYAQEVIYQLSGEIQSSSLAENVTPRGLVSELQETLKQYVGSGSNGPANVLLAGASGSSVMDTALEAGQMLREAHAEVASFVEATYARVKGAEGAAAKTTALAEGVQSIKSKLAWGHARAGHAARAAREQHARGEGAAPAVSWASQSVRAQLKHLNRTADLHSWVLGNFESLATANDARSVQLSQMAVSAVARARPSDGALIDVKLDAIERNLEAVMSDARRRAFRDDVDRLARVWDDASWGMREYLDKANDHLAFVREGIDHAASYESCKSNSAALSRVASRLHQKSGAAKASLRTLIPRSLRSLQRHDEILSEHLVWSAAVLHAADFVLDAQDTDAAALAKKVLSPSGAREALVRVAAALDEIPLSLAKNALVMVHQVRFLLQRTQIDGGRPARRRDHDAMKNFGRSTVKRFVDALGPLRERKGAASMVRRIVRNTLLQAAPAPTVCSALAFDKFRIANTRDLVTLARFNATATLVGPASVANLLGREAPYRCVIGTGCARAGVPEANAMFVCNEPADQAPSLERATAHGSGLAVCSGSACRGDEILRVASAADIPAAGFADTQLLRLFF